MRNMRKLTKALCLALALILLALPLAACGSGDDAGSTPSIAEPPPFVDDGPEYTPGGDDLEPEPEDSEPPPESVSEPASSEPPVSSEPEELPPQPAPSFIENTPAVAVNGNKVTVTFKTDVESTVNVILATTGDGISTTTFYDYFNRGKALSQAVSKQTVYNVTSGGASATFEVPDSNKGYYLLINAAENATGTWQSYVSVVTLYDPSKAPPGFSDMIVREKDVNGNLVFAVKTNVKSNVYFIITSGSAATPTPEDVRIGGTGYGGGNKIILQGSGSTGGDKEPYKGNFEAPRGGLEQGNYIAWFTMQNADYPEGPLAAVGKVTFTLS